LNYTYDPVGNIVEVVDNAQQIHYFSNSVIEPRGMYKYDALYRLTKAQGREKSGIANAPTNADLSLDIPLPNTGTNCMENFTQLFEYDKLGNILSMASQGKWLRNYVYDTNTNQLLKHDPQQTLPDYTYDQHGNITSMPGIEEMLWNHNDLMTKTQSGTVTTYYTYGSSGERTRKVSEKQGGLREERLYVGAYEVYRKYQNNVLVTERTTTHISDDKSRIALTEKLTIDNEIPVTTTETVRYQYGNHLGSSSLELDENAQIISYEEYHPFGTTSYQSGNNETEVKRKRYRYVGKERDEETGLYNYGFRMYAAWLGRFVSVDPLQFEYPQLTPFNYVGNKPITHIDIDGLQGTGDKKLGIDPNRNKNKTIYSDYYFPKGTTTSDLGGRKPLTQLATTRRQIP
jgi:RHS repeat-associated protein